MTKYFETEINSDEITAALNKSSKEIKNLEPALKIARNRLISEIDKNFKTQGESSGERFKDWTDKYAKYRAKKKKSEGKILQFEGYLRKSISSQITRKELIIGSNMEYAATHQFGYKPRNLESRPFMRITDEAKKEIAKDIMTDLKERIKL